MTTTKSSPTTETLSLTDWYELAAAARASAAAGRKMRRIFDKIIEVDPDAAHDNMWPEDFDDYLKDDLEQADEALDNAIMNADLLQRDFEERHQELKEAKGTVLDRLLKFIADNPGCLRRDIQRGAGLKKLTLNMYLTTHYGYLVGCSRWNRPEYIMYADYKPPKGRIIHQYFLTERGRARVQGERGAW